MSRTRLRIRDIVAECIIAVIFFGSMALAMMHTMAITEDGYTRGADYDPVTDLTVQE